MKDKELRRVIGVRAKQRRLELGVNQPYVAEKMGVTASTIQRYEAGTIDNTKKLVLDGLADALHVSVEWLKGETEKYESDITDKKEMLIRDAMSSILSKLPSKMAGKSSNALAVMNRKAAAITRKPASVPFPFRRASAKTAPIKRSVILRCSNE